MIKTYNLENEGLSFKGDFDGNFELVSHIIEIRSMSGYVKIDLVQHKKTKVVYFTKRVADFIEQEGWLEVRE
ncbi:hypothetical protein J4460_03305 [Candidatus Woesearchaeota archaeon]|nr:MAG: hypothetical protein QS99_C0008G0032 [archaeon GW2011_AR4]MBS3129675.1 hypothetical protein [Candidatus Woesearchaeota archaeon]HIH38779.1 hypothetical protein [Candidatus Woesearchaeota archaeon]HIH49195.1 hypothetical protein [Candidatus Woesearchaeota archaeon]HIJ03337.1 hypothetical protein [Candidatus Woesearchaeota archaeon]